MMNKTQRGAWFTLGIAVLLVAFGVIIFQAFFAEGPRTAGTDLVKLWSVLISIFMFGGVIFLRKKQSPSEPDFDERDNLIKKNAVLTCFVSIWVSLILASLIPAMVLGDYGALPVSMLPIINISVFLIAMIVYSLAILLQYSRGPKGEES